MKAVARDSARLAEHGRGNWPAAAGDPWLWVAAGALFVFGLVMVASASVGIAERLYGAPFHLFWRQAFYAVFALVAACLAWRLPLESWSRFSMPLLFLGLGLLVLVLIPGIGREVNGSARWLPLGPFSIQPSEFMKLFLILYLAGYLVRRNAEVRHAARGFIKPMLVLALVSALLLAEPDFGAVAVLMATAVGMLFLGGVRLWQFLMLLLVVALGLTAMAVSSPYRLERILAFLDPWADPFASGFQLTQALIAFGRGEWFGVGLGHSIQKLFYLPEAHTDFLFAVVAEELGLVGAAAVLLLFVILVWRAFRIARRAERAGLVYGAYLAYGGGLWLGIQAFVNMGVNMGILPTKGLTLPLMSYGGSSLLVTCVMVVLLQRVARETAEAEA